MRVKSFFALVGVIAIPVTIILVSGRNPLPWLANKVENARSISDPPTLWRVDVGNTPEWAQAPDSTVVAVGGEHLVTVIDQHSGDRRWRQAADWGAVAGSTGEGGAVVVLGGVNLDNGERKALEVRDADSGSVLWPNKGDADVDAIAAWTFTDMVITLTCPKSSACTLIAHHPRSSADPLWHQSLPSEARVLRGGNPSLAVLQSLLAAHPATAPPVLGFPAGDKVYLVDTASGRVLETPASSPASRVVAAGPGALRVEADLVNDACRYTLRWTPLLHQGTQWSRNQYQPRTSGGGACEPKDRPAGDGGLLYVSGPGHREAVLGVTTGDPVYSTADDERILAAGAEVDGGATVVLVRTAKQDSVSARSLASGKELWSEPIKDSTQTGTDGSVMTFVAPDAGTLTVRRLASGTVAIKATTLATLLGYTADGVVLDEALRVGLLPFGSVHP